MLLRDGLLIGAHQHLYIGGCDTVILAREYGTPLYVYDEMYFRNQCRQFVSAIRKYTDSGIVAYASKAMNCLAFCRIIEEEGMHLDVVSAGELYTAQIAGFPMEHVFFHGNSKTIAELKMAIDLGVGCIVLDNIQEIAALEQIAYEYGKTAKVMIRLNPGIETKTHAALRTANRSCKFGISIDTGDALAAVKQIQRCEHLHLTGFHTHLGSQLFQVEPYYEAITRLTDFMTLATVVCGQEFENISLGGGFGVRYSDDDLPTPDIDSIVRLLSERISVECQRKGLRIPSLILEPGRLIAAESCIALYTVNSIKEIANECTYINIDGGMADNPRVALYGAQYEALLANRAGERGNTKIAIAGRACESGDVLGYNFILPYPHPGDIVAFLNTGAYQYSMAGHYNRTTLPAVVLVRYGKSDLIQKRQTFEELISLDIIPDRLRKREE